MKRNKASGNKRKVIIIILLVVLACIIFNESQYLFYMGNVLNCGTGSKACSVELNEPFTLLSSYNTFFIGGCFLGEIRYDKNYLEEISPLTIRSTIDYLFGSSRTLHRFIPIKLGRTTVSTSGSCGYSMTYAININQ
jgi:hypothetical protein